ncbi:MAG: DUF1146 domain-containing protein [Faecalicoccus sp.]|jgi:uncharacterized integral membrane protein (TIGR02327 family)|nr:DUF1146 domain-containing protein [Faecalicoccus sp.]
MTVSIIQLLVFAVCFALSFWAISAVQFDKFCNVRQPAKVMLLMFLLSLVLGYLSSQAIFALTIFNGL